MLTPAAESGSAHSLKSLDGRNAYCRGPPLPRSAIASAISSASCLHARATLKYPSLTPGSALSASFSASSACSMHSLLRSSNLAFGVFDMTVLPFDRLSPVPWIRHGSPDRSGNLFGVLLLFRVQ